MLITDIMRKKPLLQPHEDTSGSLARFPSCFFFVFFIIPDAVLLFVSERGQKENPPNSCQKWSPCQTLNYITSPNSFHSLHIPPFMFFQIKKPPLPPLPPFSSPSPLFLTSSSSSAPHAVQMLAPGCAHASVNTLTEPPSLLLRRIR